MLPITVVILTWNEEKDLLACIDSVLGLSDDVLIVDSYSTDQTVQLAEKRGISVFSNPFTGFGDQRNWAIDCVPHKYPWVLHLDADERATPQFADEIAEILSRNPSEAGFFVPSKLMLGEHWLRYSSGYPVYQVRLFHRERLRFVNHGHGQREQTAGQLGKMKEPYLHYAFGKGLLHWFERHAGYAAAEALEAQRGTESGKSIVAEVRSLIAGDAISRRRATKRLSYRLPFRGPLRLLHTLILKRGLLDGRAGITYARMMAIYESMVSVYLAENRLMMNDVVPDRNNGSAVIHNSCSTH